MNQCSNLNEFFKIAQNKFPPFVKVAFNSVKARSNTFISWWIVTHVTLSDVDGLKFSSYWNLLSSDCSCHYFSANERKDKLKFIKSHCGKLYQIRY